MYKYRIILCIMAFILLFGNIATNADTEYGFETVDLSSEKISRIWDTIELKTLTQTTSIDKLSEPLVSFDVSENGNILMGLENNQIIVLDNNLNLLYGFRFSDDGTFRVQWNGENILLMLIRGSTIVEFTTDAQLVSIADADSRSIQNNDLWNQIIKKNKISVGGSVYYAKRPLWFLNVFSSSYTQLIKKDIDGREIIIYDVGVGWVIKRIAIIVSVFIFIAVSVLIAVFRAYK